MNLTVMVSCCWMKLLQLFTDLLIASGATIPMIKTAMDRSVHSAAESSDATTFTDLGALLRDCMEVMCAWRRDIDMVDSSGEPMPLTVSKGSASFEVLCKKADCRHSAPEVLEAHFRKGAPLPRRRRLGTDPELRLPFP